MKKKKFYTKICVSDDDNNVVMSFLIHPYWTKSTIDKLIFRLTLAYPINYTVRLV